MTSPKAFDVPGLILLQARINPRHCGRRSAVGEKTVAFKADAGTPICSARTPFEQTAQIGGARG